MKIKNLCFLLVLLLAMPLTAAPPKGTTSSTALFVDNTTWIDVNRVLMFVTNHGNFGRDLGGYFGYDYGTFYPYAGDPDPISDGDALAILSPFYAGGLWVGGIDSASGEVRVCVSEYASEYVPGPMEGGTFMTDREEFRVYKLYSDSLRTNPNQDYLDYRQYAIAQGAPYFIDSTDGAYDSIPEMNGNQMCWSVFNDADPAQHSGVDGGQTTPLGLEVRQTIFGFNREDPLGHMVFVKWRIYNKGGRTLQNCYFSMWADPDVGGSTDDLVGVDTLLSLGYCFNADNDDNYYGSAPPASGYDFFQGPLVYTGDPADTGRAFGQRYPEYKNLGAVSFNKYINGTDPDNFTETYRYMRGLGKDGSPYLYNGDTLLYNCSGDPVAQTGDLDFAPADRRFMQSTGPIDFRPGDSTEILAAVLFGMGGDRLSSISVLRYYDRFAQSAYDVDFDVSEPPAPPVVTIGELDGEISLMWTDASELSPGDYPFQGYTVYQGPAAAGPWTRIANFDIIDGIAQIMDEVLDPNTGALETRAVKIGTDNGIQRYFVVSQDYLQGGNLHNVSEYYFRVEAYSLDPSATPKTLTSANQTPIVVHPQEPIADHEFEDHPGDVIIADHIVGVSGGAVEVEVINPNLFPGATYRVVFVDTLGIVIDTVYDPAYPGDLDHATFDSINVAWHLERINADGTLDTLLFYQTNQTNDNSYTITDGVIVRVSGPTPGFNNFICVANGAGEIDPPEAAAAEWQGFPVPLDDEGFPLRPTTNQQVGDGLWLIHTADNGGSCDLGTYGVSYNSFLSRATRDGSLNPLIGAYDFEIRFTGDNADPGTEGSYTFEGFAGNNVFWIPFEVWNTGIGTPDDPSDDVRLMPVLIDDAGDPDTWPGDDIFALESSGCYSAGNCQGDCEHSVSGGDNDPFTDWVYFYNPTDMTPGEAGYLAHETAMTTAGTYTRAQLGPEVLARIVLVNWNGHTWAEEGDTLTNPPVFTQDVPEMGTIFRMTTFKPNAPSDTFTFELQTPVEVASNEAALDNIKAVPNPFYLYSGYDPSPGIKKLAFHHLPATCTIKIFNLGGDLVRTITKDDASTAIAYWDLLGEEGIPVASGIYVYAVEAPGFGTKIGKVAIFVEQEVLQIY